jgi:hypothetical protein
MKKKICFIANYEKTFFYSEIGKVIEKKNLAEVYWIVVNLKLYKYLINHFNKNKILLINKKINNFTKNYNLLNSLKLNECLYSDRALSGNLKKNTEYLDYASTQINDFLIKKEIKYIYGEITWSHEIIAYRIANLINKLKIKFFYPCSLRYPFNRFVFFLNSEQTTLFCRKKKALFSNKISLSEYLDTLENLKPKNNLFNLNHFFTKIKNFFIEPYFDRNDPTQIPKKRRTINFINRYINYFTYKLFLKKIKSKQLKKKKYIIFFLQKKPEASIDVKGMYFEDQLKNFIMIWRLLPSNFSIVVKEHPTCIGDNSLKFYKEILKFNQTFIIDDNENFENLIKNSYATFSVASTASIQSSLLNIPSFTLVPCFFNELKYSENITISQLRELKTLNDLVKEMFKKNKIKKRTQNTIFFKNSFNGYLIGDKKFHKQNIKNIANAFFETFND